MLRSLYRFHLEGCAAYGDYTAERRLRALDPPETWREVDEPLRSSTGRPRVFGVVEPPPPLNIRYVLEVDGA